MLLTILLAQDRPPPGMTGLQGPGSAPESDWNFPQGAARLLLSPDFALCSGSGRAAPRLTGMLPPGGLGGVERALEPEPW